VAFYKGEKGIGEGEKRIQPVFLHESAPVFQLKRRENLGGRKTSNCVGGVTLVPVFEVRKGGGKEKEEKREEPVALKGSVKRPIVHLAHSGGKKDS